MLVSKDMNSPTKQQKKVLKLEKKATEFEKANRLGASRISKINRQPIPPFEF